jgi:hypothetical protein
MSRDREILQRMRKKANEDLRKQFEDMHSRGRSIGKPKKQKHPEDNRYGRKRFGT